MPLWLQEFLYLGTTMIAALVAGRYLCGFAAFLNRHNDDDEQGARHHEHNDPRRD